MRKGFNLAEGAAHTYTLAGKHRTAFTLAEVLITLGIIGIIAAMTIPALVGKYQKIAHVNQMKNTYTIISNAFLMSQQDYGDPTDWDWGTSKSRQNLLRIVNTYLIPYLNISSKENQTTAKGNYALRLKNGTTLVFELDGCLNPDTCKPIDITALYITASHKNKESHYASSDRDYSREDYTMVFKKNQKTLQFFNWGGNTREGMKNVSKYACNKNIAKHQRYNCGALIFYDGWTIKNDYPW